MATFLDSEYYNRFYKSSDGVKNPFEVGTKPKPKTAHAPAKGAEADVGGLLASGQVDGVKVDNKSEQNFFMTGHGVSASEVSAVNVNERKDKLAAFNTAYRNFMSNPSKETALALREAYYGKDGDNPIIDNKNVEKLYSSKEEKIEKLINS